MGRTSDHVGLVGVSEVDLDIDLDVDLKAPLEITGTEWADCIEIVDSASSGGNQVLPRVSWSSVVAKGATHVARANHANVVLPQKSPPTSSMDFVILHKQGLQEAQDQHKACGGRGYSPG